MQPQALKIRCVFVARRACGWFTCYVDSCTCLSDCIEPAKILKLNFRSGVASTDAFFAPEYAKTAFPNGD